MVNTKVGQSISYRLAQFYTLTVVLHIAPLVCLLLSYFGKCTLRTRLDIMKPDVSKVVTQNQLSRKIIMMVELSLGSFSW